MHDHVEIRPRQPAQVRTPDGRGGQPQPGPQRRVRRCRARRPAPRRAAASRRRWSAGPPPGPTTSSTVGTGRSSAASSDAIRLGVAAGVAAAAAQLVPADDQRVRVDAPVPPAAAGADRPLQLGVQVGRVPPRPSPRSGPARRTASGPRPGPGRPAARPRRPAGRRRSWPAPRTGPSGPGPRRAPAARSAAPARTASRPERASRSHSAPTVRSTTAPVGATNRTRASSASSRSSSRATRPLASVPGGVCICGPALPQRAAQQVTDPVVVPPLLGRARRLRERVVQPAAGRAEHELGLVEPERRRVRLLARQRGQPLPQPAQRPEVVHHQPAVEHPRAEVLGHLDQAALVGDRAEPAVDRPLADRQPGRRVLDQRRLRRRVDPVEEAARPAGDPGRVHAERGPPAAGPGGGQLSVHGLLHRAQGPPVVRRAQPHRRPSS